MTASDKEFLKGFEEKVELAQGKSNIVPIIFTTAYP
mgnify:CR=1 FL=1